jgi:MFS family permease
VIRAMYITLQDRPATPGPRTGPDRARGRRVPQVPQVVVTLGLVSLVTDISSESVNAILPLYLTSVLGLSVISYGLVDALQQGVSSLVRIGGGWAADRGGHPKWVAFCGYGLSAAARFALLFSSGLAAISAVVGTDRIGKGLRTAPRDAIISAATPPRHLGAAFGVHRTLDTVGAAIGPLLAFAILWWIPDGYLTVMVASFGFAVIGVAMLGLLVPDRPAPSAPPAPSTPPDDPLAPHNRAFRWRQVAEPGLLRLLVVAGGLGVLTIGDGFLYLALLDRGGFAAHWFPLLYVGTNVAYLALAIPVGRLADRVGKAAVLVAGHLLLLAAYLCAALPWSGAAVAVTALLLLGAFYAATDGVIAALAGRLVDPSARASGIASAQTVVAVARMVASAGFGVLWFAVGPQLALVVVGTGLLVAVAVASTSVARLDAIAGARP